MSQSKTQNLSYHLPAPEGIVPGEAFDAPTGSVVPSTDLFKEPQRVTIVSGDTGDARHDLAMVCTATLDPAHPRLAKSWVYGQNEYTLGATETRELEPGEFITHKWLGFYTARLEGEWTAEDPESGRVFFEPVSGSDIYTCTKYAWCGGHSVSEHIDDRVSHSGGVANFREAGLEVGVWASLHEGELKFQLDMPDEWWTLQPAAGGEIQTFVQLVQRAQSFIEAFELEEIAGL